jgi:hypothetical protein
VRIRVRTVILDDVPDRVGRGWAVVARNQLIDARRPCSPCTKVIHERPVDPAALQQQAQALTRTAARDVQRVRREPVVIETRYSFDEEANGLLHPADDVRLLQGVEHRPLGIAHDDLRAVDLDLSEAALEQVWAITNSGSGTLCVMQGGSLR